MIANIIKTVVALGLFSFVSSENGHAAKWDSDHEDNAAAYAHPVYVNISHSPESQNSQEEVIKFEDSSTSSRHVTSEQGKVRVFRTKTAHRSGRLFVQPARFNEPSTNIDKNGDPLFQEGFQENPSEYDNNEISLDSISYATQLLGQEHPETLISYIQ